MALYSTALARVLPPTGTAYLALLVTGPSTAGVGEVEASYAGYARVGHSAWALHKVDDLWHVSNTGSIVFAAVTGAAITVTHWGIYLVAVGGDLFASGAVRSLLGVAQPQYLAVGDQARFLDDALKIRSGV